MSTKLAKAFENYYDADEIESSLIIEEPPLQIDENCRDDAELEGDQHNPTLVCIFFFNMEFLEQYLSHVLNLIATLFVNAYKLIYMCPSQKFPNNSYDILIPNVQRLHIRKIICATAISIQAPHEWCDALILLLWTDFAERRHIIFQIYNLC